jgi:hypothetical protein
MEICMRTMIAAGTLLACLGAPLPAQEHREHTAAGAGATHAAAGWQHLSANERQIAAAVLAAPEAYRAGAGVLGYDAAGKLVELRKPANEMLCLADDPKEARFHVACYHVSLEPFMARGRELTAQGVTGMKRDSIRNADVLAGRVQMPAVAGLYTLTARPGCFDANTGVLCDRVDPVHSVYVPMATTASTGLLDHPTDEHTPFLMSPGTPRAHIMFGAHQH